MICNTGHFCHAIRCNFCYPEVPHFEVQFITHRGFQCQLFSVLSRHAAFIYCTMEWHFESSNLKLLQHRGYVQNCRCKQGNTCRLKHEAILYNKAEVFSLSVTNPNGRPMLPFDWLIHRSLILASCHRILFLCRFSAVKKEIWKLKFVKKIQTDCEGNLFYLQ